MKLAKIYKPRSLLLATWRYEHNPHAAYFVKSDEITEFKDLNLHKSR